MTNDNLVLRVAALKVVSDYAKRRYDAARAEAAAVMRRGDRLMARSPLNELDKLAAVSKTDPKPVARVSDETALLAWVERHYPDKVGWDFDIIGSDQEVKAVLFEHAPHLLRKIRLADPELVKQIRSDSAALGAPIGPGGEADVDGVTVETPEGTVACKPTDDALGVVVDLARAGVLSLEELVRPELPGGAE